MTNGKKIKSKRLSLRRGTIAFMSNRTNHIYIRHSKLGTDCDSFAMNEGVNCEFRCALLRYDSIVSLRMTNEFSVWYDKIMSLHAYWNYCLRNWLLLILSVFIQCFFIVNLFLKMFATINFCLSSIVNIEFKNPFNRRIHNSSRLRWQCPHSFSVVIACLIM